MNRKYVFAYVGEVEEGGQCQEGIQGQVVSMGVFVDICKAE